MIRLVIALLGLVMLVGCGNDLASPPTEGSVPGLASAKITIKWPEVEARTIPAETQSIRVQVSVNGVEVRNIVVARQPGLVTTVNLTDLPVGSAVFTGNAYPTTDGTGQVLASGQATVTLVAGQTAVVSIVLTPTPPGPDTTPPTVNIVSPLDGAVVSGTVSIEATATDNVGVVGVRFIANGVDLGEDINPPYQMSWDTTPIPYESVAISAVARDAAGNVGTDSITVTVNNIAPPPDTTPPTVQITSPDHGATVSGVITIEANASDNVAVAGVRFIADAVDLGEDITSPYQASWDTTSFPNGIYTIQATARDAAGNNASYSIVVAVGNLGPFEPFRGQVVSFTVTTGPGEGLSFLEDFGQIILNCRPGDLVSGQIPWYGNFEDRQDGIVIAELKCGGYINPITGVANIALGVNPGPFGDALRRFDSATGNVTENRAVTGGSVAFVEFNTPTNPNRLIFWNPVVNLDNGTVLSDDHILSETWIIL